MVTDYYNINAEAYIADTRSVDMHPVYQEFLAYIPEGGRIIDAGCGSGRDTRFFMLKGFNVIAFDASQEMVNAASAYAGLQVKLATFQNFQDPIRCDGIWACASLLHVPKGELTECLNNLSNVMKSGAVLYASFKYGNTERIQDGRHFTDMDETTLDGIVGTLVSLSVLKIWKTKDVRPGRNHEVWFNILLKNSEFSIMRHVH